MEWPRSILKIIRHYYIIQADQNNELTKTQKDQFVKELVGAYNALSPKEKTDVLVPERGEFLKDTAITVALAIANPQFSIRYRWPGGDGFAGDEKPTELLPGEEYDRLGGEWGRFLSPLVEGKPQSCLSRAIPYYVPEKDISQNPAYHRYKIGTRYTDNQCRRGTISSAFREDPQDGGGIQVSLGKTIKEIKCEGRGVFDG